MSFEKAVVSTERKDRTVLEMRAGLDFVTMERKGCLDGVMVRNKRDSPLY